MATPGDTKPESWQRYFAIEANNRAWDLTVSPQPAQRLELLKAAHAAAHHWDSVGNETHVMRANLLLALAHTLAGSADLALALAQDVKAFFLARDDTPDWEIAYVHLVLAHAAAVSGQRGLHQSAYADAKAAFDAISDPEDRAIVEPNFKQVPEP